MSGLSSILTAGSTVAGAASSWADAQSQRIQGNYQNEMAGINAKYAELQAESAITRGNKQATDMKRETKKIISSQRVALAAQGISIEDGSALQVQEDTAMIGEIEAMKIKNNAWMEAFGYKMEAQNLRTAGALAKRAGNNAAATTIATGGWNAVSGGIKTFTESNTYNKFISKEK